MPELPDLVYIEKNLRPVVLDREIMEASVWEPIVLRMGVPGSFAGTLPGKTIIGLRRHGPFLVFTLQVFKDKIARSRRQVRVFLMDQSLLSAVGNAYADEILFASRIHPKTGCNQLREEEIDRLYHSIVSVLAWGIEEEEKAGRPIDVRVRSHLVSWDKLS